MKNLSLLLASITLLLSATIATASINKNTYFLKGEPITGSLIKRIDATSNIPFNKAYDDLNQEQQGLVKKMFVNLGISDTPPYPKNGLGSVYKPLINANKKFGSNSTIKVNASITRNGLVDDVEVLNSPNSEFVAYVQKQLRNTKFKPASCNGISCEMNFPIEISFN